LIPKDAPGALPDGVPCAPENGSICWRWEEDRFILQLQDRLPPRRWSHLLANECFGWLTDECGTGFLWYGNAHENQLTPWQGDPLANSGGEELLLRWGEEAVSLFAAQDGWRTVVTYSPGKAVWSKEKDGRTISLIAEVPLSRPCRSFHITISGFSGAARLLWRVTPLLGRRKQDARFVQVQEENGTLCLNNPVNQDFPQVLSLRAMDEKLDWQWETPETLALSCRIDRELTLLTSLSPLQLKLGDQLLQPLRNDWTQLSSPLTLQSPDPALNHYMSVWALYQVVACRLFARTGLYQCGGAYGFRDQLQDVCALIPTAPELARQQIVRAACHQFREGDVQHWWHPNGNGQPEWGIRTRISDDLLWLPYALSVWMETTGDRSLLQAKAPWLESPPLAPEEQERYEQPCITQDRNSLYEHGCAAIHCVLQRGTGCHDLLLMGTGDWNDGLNHIGAKGKGESVWLTWFASVVLSRWSSVAEKLGDSIRAARCLSHSKELALAADRAWDGAWYLRGYDDQGHPFGGMQCKDCKIDSIAQSFSAFAPNPQPERAKTAVLQAVQHLYDPESKTTALLKDGYQPGGSAGYIQSYPVGVRENGGQYTHAAVWLASACYQIGCPETGWQILRDLLPENHVASVYQGEPYVLAGDVSTSEGYQGRCGWSWYTGAAGWYYRTVLESLLGIHIREGVMTITPQLPEKWDGYHADLRLPELTIRLTVHCGAAEGMLLNGVPAGEILLDQYGGELEVTVFCK
jgi:cyclic beta-1,2-glucan synthetase